MYIIIHKPRGHHPHLHTPPTPINLSSILPKMPASDPALSPHPSHHPTQSSSSTPTQPFPAILLFIFHGCRVVCNSSHQELPGHLWLSVPRAALKSRTTGRGKPSKVFNDHVGRNPSLAWADHALFLPRPLHKRTTIAPLYGVTGSYWRLRKKYPEYYLDILARFYNAPKYLSVKLTGDFGKGVGVL